MIPGFPDPVFLQKGSVTPFKGYLTPPQIFELQANDTDLLGHYQDKIIELEKSNAVYKSEYWDKYKYCLAGLVLGFFIGVANGH